MGRPQASSATHGVESSIKSKNGAPVEERQECERAVLIERYILSCIDMSLITQLMTIIHPRLSLTPTRAPLHVQQSPQPMSRNGHDQERLVRQKMPCRDATLMPLLGSAAICHHWSSVGTSERLYRQEGSRG